MSLRIILLALTLEAAISHAAVADDRPDGPEAESPATTAPAEIIYLGVMGEVAHPGVYAVPKNCSLGGLLQRAGGVTKAAKETVRVFRGGRPAEQVFLKTAGTATLFAGDLVCVENRGASSSPSSSPKTGRPSGPPAHPREVQIALLNVIDQPIVVKMRAEQATVAQIVEFLRQPALLASRVRVFPPSSERSRHDSIWGPDRSLVTGTVVVFPPRSVRQSLLPPLPVPMFDDSSRTSSKGMTLSQYSPSTRHAVIVGGRDAVRSPPPVITHGLGSQSVIAEAEDPFSDREQVNQPKTAQLVSTEVASDVSIVNSDVQSSLNAQPAKARDGARTIPQRLESFDSSSRGSGSRSHRPINLTGLLTSIAAAVMLVTLASIFRRNTRSLQFAWRVREAAVRMLRRAKKASPSSAPAGPLSVSYAVSGLARPVQVDANQTITRLGVDLSVIEPTKQQAAA